MCRIRNRYGECALRVTVLCLLLAAYTHAATLNETPPSVPMLSLRAGQVLAVIGIKQELVQRNKTEWQSLRDRRIGFGLNNLLVDTLYDTGKFRLAEEKDVHKREIIEELVHVYWIEQRPYYSGGELRRVAMELDAELLAYATIVYSESSRRRMSIGPVSRSVQKLQVTVHVCLFEPATHALLCRYGRGEAQQEGVGVIYEPRGDRLDFENNAAGRATKQAVALAVKELMVSIHFAP